MLAASLLGLAVVSLLWISRPGPSYDETVFVPAAVGDDDPAQPFVRDRVLGVPTMVLPYIGALKSWLYAPVFAAFGVSISTIRVPAVLVAVAAVLLAFMLARRLFGAWPAALLVVVLATDPVFAFMTKVDWGPIALAALLRMVALVSYFALLRTGSTRYLLVLLSALLLGLFNKFDFAWFVASLGAAALIFHRRQLVALLRRAPVAAGLPLAAFLGVVFVMAVTLILPVRDLDTGIPERGLADRLDVVVQLSRDTLDGDAVYWLWTGRHLDDPTPIAAVLVLALAALAVLFATVLLRRGSPQLRETARDAAFLLTVFACSALLFVFTPQAAGPHHVMQLWPFPQLLAVAVVAAALTIQTRYVRIGAASLAVVALLVLALAQAGVQARYLRALRSGESWTPIWSPEIYSLAGAARRAEPQVDAIVTTDWGVGQVFALGGDQVRDKFEDRWPQFVASVPDGDARLVASVFRHRRVLVLARTDAAEMMPGVNERLRRVVAALPGGSHTVYAGSTFRAFVVTG